MIIIALRRVNSQLERAYQQLLNHTHKPIPQNQISEKNMRIEDYLHHTLEIYQKSLDRSRKTMDRKKSHPQSWPECLTPDNGSQTENKSCDHRWKLIGLNMNLLFCKSNCLNIIKTFGRFMTKSN
ncbi:hypothetical protein GLOIN_2v1773502 [Rhizophagus irregularis DAOM 181602=DAOM 197198]|nr:hypothetical protein GLOIN_2v1773502 [Rhizophagus irregularis DAOM 181602=DAOM 197198]